MQYAVLLMLSLVLFSRTCLACSCAQISFVTKSGESRSATSLEQVAVRYFRADAVFIGHVTEVRQIALKHLGLPGELSQRYHTGEETHFQVLKSWKGDLGSHLVMHSMLLTNCAISFEPKEDYLVYARWGSFGTYATGFCSTTRPLGVSWYRLDTQAEIDLLEKFAPFDSILGR